MLSDMDRWIMEHISDAQNSFSGSRIEHRSIR